jgi:hypothetical protein
MSETLELLRDKVWAARIAANADDTTYAERLAEFEAANARLVESRKRAHQHVAEAESALRAAAEAHYRVTGEKKPVDGVAIREAVSLEYAAADAVAWAKTAMPQLVHEVLDVKAFDKVAKAAPTAVPFVTVVTTGKATIATELVPSPGYRPSVEDLSITGAPF